MKYVKQLAALAALSLALVPGAKAVPTTVIQGDITFTGTLQLKTNGSPASNMLTSNLAEFVSGTWTVDPAGGSTGDYAALTGAAVTFGVSTVSTIEGTYSTPITPFWTVVSGGNTYTFDMASYSVDRTPNTLPSGAGNKSISWSGTGTATGTGFLSNNQAVWSMIISQTSATNQVTLT